MSALAQIVEMDQERDRKTCLTLDLKVTGANRELAQWLLDHPRYPNTAIASWLGCNEKRIRKLREWAEDGFVDLPNSRYKRNSSPATNATLETNDNSESDAVEHDEDGVVIDGESDIVSPDQVEDNILYALQRINENARAFSKILRASALDREAVERINTAVDRMIHKWRSIQSTLEKKG